MNTITTTWQNDWNIFLAKKYEYKSDKTPKSAAQHLRVFSRWFSETTQKPFNPQELTSFDLREYQRFSLHQEKVAGDTWNLRLWALRIFCEFIGLPDLAKELRRQNVGVKSSRYRALSNAERHAILRQLEINLRGAKSDYQINKAQRELASITLLLATGLRVEEIRDLSRSDIQINERSGKVTVRHGKGDKERDVPLGPDIRRQLGTYLDYRQVHTPQGHALDPRGATDMDTSDSLFGISKSTLERSVSKAGKSAGVDGVSPHWLRYTFAKLLEANGQTIELIRDFLGHNTIETTRTYLRSGSEQRQSAVDALF